MPGAIDTINELMEAINDADLERAVATYEDNAVLVVVPGRMVHGTAQIREALAGFIALKADLRSEAQKVIETKYLALYIGRWSLRGNDAEGKAVEMGGESTDILRRQMDGRWLIALDNPWGTQILPK